MAADTSRSIRVSIRITESVMDKLQRYSEELGMPPTTVAAQFVCEGLRNKEMQSNAMQAVIEHQIKQVQDMADVMFSDPEKLAAFAKSMGISESHLLDK